MARKWYLRIDMAIPTEDDRSYEILCTVYTLSNSNHGPKICKIKADLL